jgi:hypothetical protein
MYIERIDLLVQRQGGHALVIGRWVSVSQEGGVFADRSLRLGLLGRQSFGDAEGALAARRFCCGLGEPSFETRFAKSGVFAGD